MSSLLNGTKVEKIEKGIVIQDFANVSVKSVNVLDREGKKPLVFIDLVDTDSYQNTGEMMYLKKDITTSDIMNLKSLERKKVKAVLQLGIYNNRPSINITDLVELS